MACRRHIERGRERDSEREGRKRERLVPALVSAAWELVNVSKIILPLDRDLLEKFVVHEYENQRERNVIWQAVWEAAKQVTTKHSVMLKIHGAVMQAFGFALTADEGDSHTSSSKLKG